jgi:hypothetical protein
MPYSGKLKGPKSAWDPRKASDDSIADLQTINDWAKELQKWAKIITDGARQFEASGASATEHIPDPPPPPFSDPI